MRSFMFCSFSYFAFFPRIFEFFLLIMFLLMTNFSEDISGFSDSDLVSYSIKLAQHESKVSLQLVNCLRETERRMIYLALGYSSLWEFCTLHLGLSSGNAQLKIDAMRLFRDHEVAREKIESGELSLVNAAKVNRFFRQEKKAGKVYTPEKKAEVIENVAGLSQSQCERALLSLAPESIPAEKVRPLTDTKTELKIVVDENTMGLLNRVKELLSNQMPGASFADVLDYMAREQVKILEKKQMGAVSVETETPGLIEAREASAFRSGLIVATQEIESTSTVELSEEPAISQPVATSNRSVKTARSYISVHDRRWAMKNANGQCEFVSSGGKRCQSRRKLEIDHKIPLFLGGRNERQNYRALCKFHNLYYARKNIGPIVAKYVPSLR